MTAKSRPKTSSKPKTRVKVVSNRKASDSTSWLRKKWVAPLIILVVVVIGVVTLALSRAASIAGPVTGVGNKCLDNNAAKIVNGNKIQLYDCNKTAAQNWTIPGDGTLRIQGYCLDVPGASKKQETVVQLYQCNGTVAQKWTINSNGSIVNPNSGLCLDDKYASTANGNPIWMYACNGTVAQKWTVPKLPTTTPTNPPTPPTGPTACSPLPITLPAAKTMQATKKKVFAFYFPPFPVSVDNKAPANDSYASWLYSLNAQGGKYDLRDRPITRSPWSRSDWKQADFEVEIRRAEQAGIDGFMWEYHTSSDARWNQLPAMLAAAKAVDPGFKIMLSPDFSLDSGASPDSVVNDVLKVKDESAIYRNDKGEIVLSPFYPERQPVSFWDSMKSKLVAKGVKTALVPMFLSWSGSTSEKSEWTSSHVYGYSQWGTRSPGGISTLDKDAAEAHRRGGIWIQPVAFEDTRSYDGRFWEANNSTLLRDSFMSAINNNADMVVMNTWNDYTESWMSPTQNRGYAVTDVASYYIDWFKTGKAPTVTQDATYWFHRSQNTNAAYSKTPVGRNGQAVKMAVPNGGTATNDVEMVAFLTQPATLTITQGSVVKTMNAPAGLTSFKTPLVAGTTPSFSITRNGKSVQSIKSNTPIKASVTFQDMMYHAGGGTAVSCARP